MSQKRAVRFRALSRTLAAAAAVAVLAACSEGARQSPTAPRVHAARQWDGESLFRGLVLGDGDVAQAFPEIWAGRQVESPTWTPAERLRVRQARTALVASMRRSDPQFFDRFGQALNSGDPVRIDAAMEDARAVLTRVVAPHGFPRQKPDGSDKGACVTLAVAANVALAVNVAAAWNIAVYANAVYNENFFWEYQQVDRSPLQHDQAVALIASRLGGR
jgi:SdpC family antimicrobial peptide